MFEIACRPCDSTTAVDSEDDDEVDRRRPMVEGLVVDSLAPDFSGLLQVFPSFFLWVLDGCLPFGPDQACVLASHEWGCE